MSNQDNVVVLYKPVGATPLEMIRALQKAYPEYANKKLGYAGRLDPMAEGLLLILVDEENTNRKQMEQLTKHYTCEALFGIETDSYDLLGRITNKTLPVTLSTNQLETVLKQYKGKQTQQYPPYSSPRVNGHPLFWWAREGRLSEITIPEKEIEIFDIRVKHVKEIQLSAIESSLFEKLRRIQGEFRQAIILQEWQIFIEQNRDKKTCMATLEIDCSSGTYMRSLIHNIGITLTCGAVAFSITRTQVGNYSIEHALHLKRL